MSDLSALFEMPLFAGFARRATDMAVRESRRTLLRKGELLMREGQRVTHQFILLDGELVTEKMLCGRQVFDDRRVAPTSIAETALLADMPLCY